VLYSDTPRCLSNGRVASAQGQGGFAVDADVRACPLGRPCVDRTLGAVGPLDAHCDRDGVAVVADVEAVEFAGPLVGRVLDGLTVHTPSVEQMFAQRKRSLSRRLASIVRGRVAGRLPPLGHHDGAAVPPCKRRHRTHSMPELASPRLVVASS
jgi:hypothetical protein